MRQVVAAHHSRPARPTQALTIPLARDYRIARQAIAELEEDPEALAAGLPQAHEAWEAAGEPEEEGSEHHAV